MCAECVDVISQTPTSSVLYSPRVDEQNRGRPPCTSECVQSIELSHMLPLRVGAVSTICAFVPFAYTPSAIEQADASEEPHLKERLRKDRAGFKHTTYRHALDGSGGLAGVLEVNTEVRTARLH